MVFKKIKKRSSQNTMTGVVMGLLLVMAIFFGSYLYITDNVDSANVTLDDKYAESYSNLTDSRDELDDNVQEIQDSFDNIKEADNTFEAAWNGFKGLGSILKLPISFVSTTIATWQAIVPTLDIVPTWALTLIFIGITAFIVFLVLKILKGEPNM